MGLFHYLWSRTAASNATADSNVNWAEGQSPSSVNDSARAMMASAAGFRDDISGAIVTTGTSTAYAVTSYQIFDSLAHMNGMMIAFTPHATNGAAVTLNVDGLGAKPLRFSSQATGIDPPPGNLSAGVLAVGTPYVATYNSSDAVWYLHGMYGNPYNVPLGCGLDCWAATTPNSSFVFANGTSISRSTYATLFALIGTTYGAGDGSTTFALPDVRSRVTVKRDDMGGGATNRTTTAGGGLDSVTLGAVGGAQNVTLTADQIPSLTSSGSNSITVTSLASTYASGSTNGNLITNGSGSFFGAGSLSPLVIGAIPSTGSNSISVTYTNGSPSVTKTTPAAIVCNYIMRVI